MALQLGGVAPAPGGEALHACAEADARRLLQPLVQAEHGAGALAGVRRTAELELLFHAWRFARAQRHTPEQLAALLGIVRALHADTVATPVDNMEEVAARLRARLTAHAVRRPPFSEQIFTLAQTKAIQQYLLRTYFRQFRLYKHTFVPRVRLTVRHEPKQEQQQQEEEEEGKTVEEEEEKAAEEKTAAEGKTVEEEANPEQADPPAAEAAAREAAEGQTEAAPPEPKEDLPPALAEADAAEVRRIQVKEERERRKRRRR